MRAIWDVRGVIYDERQGLRSEVMMRVAVTGPGQAKITRLFSKHNGPEIIGLDLVPNHAIMMPELRKEGEVVAHLSIEAALVIAVLP